MNMEASTRVYFSLGSNIGNRKRNLLRTLRLLGRRGIAVKRVSSIYETEPVGFKAQNRFLNLAVEGETELQPRALLKQCKQIERDLGRTKTRRFGPRIIDIDILIYDNSIVNTKELTLPHPRLASRNFVLIPLVEIAPRVKHPLNLKTMRYLLNHSPDKAGVEKYCKPLTY